MRFALLVYLSGTRTLGRVAIAGFVAVAHVGLTHLVAVR